MADDPAALGADIDLPAFKLDGKALDARVAEAVTAGTIELTIEGAPTLEITVRDTERRLLRSKLFAARVQMKAVGERWELVQIRKQGNDLVLVFEQYLVAVLKRSRGARKSKRGKVTRAEFVKALLDEIKQPRFRLICPELHVKQPIAKAKDRESRKSKDDRRAPGIAKDADLTVKGVSATAGQLQIAERALDVAESKDAPERAMVALIAAMIVEALLGNPAGGEGSSVGPLQLVDDHLGGSTSENGGRRDLELVVSMFLDRGFTGQGGAIELAKAHPGWSPGQIAQAVQGSAHPGRYDEHADEARVVVDAYGGAGGGTRSRKKPFWFTRGKRESTWKASGRLAEEVGWRRFVVGDKFYFVAEEDLMRSKPRMTLREHRDGVDDIDFDIDTGRDADEATVNCRAKIWKAPPGSVVVIKDCGPQADGRWLVSTLRRGLFSLGTEITLRRGRALLDEKPEPANETVAINRSGRKTGGRIITTAGGAKGIVEKAAEIAESVNGNVYVGSDYRAGDTDSDHGGNDSSRAARDLGYRGIDLHVGPPHAALDEAVALIGEAFGRDYGDGKSTIIDTFNWEGYRVQIIWRTPLYGGHMGHIHIGARRL